MAMLLGLTATLSPAPRTLTSRQTCIDEFLKELRAATTSVDRRRDVGGVARDCSVGFCHGLQYPAPAPLRGAHLSAGVVLRQKMGDSCCVFREPDMVVRQLVEW